jgi:uncharacterized membrane protein
MIEQGPLRIKTPVPDDTYFSIAIYALNTDEKRMDDAKKIQYQV